MADILRITERQHAALKERMRIEADARMTGYAREAFPDQFANASDSTIAQLIERVRAQAARYAIEEENDVACCLDLAVMFGEQFHLEDWAQPTLAVLNLSGSEKMERLMGMLREAGVDI